MAKQAPESIQPIGERRVSSRVAARQASSPAVKEVESAKKAPAAKATKKRAAAKQDEEAEVESKDNAETTNADGDKKGDVNKKAKREEAAVKGDGKPASGGQLKVGDAVPELTLNDESGQTVEVGKLKKAVIFMYPKANTGGCTNQAQAYRDEYSSWKELGYSVYGLSSDNVTPLKNWKEKYSFEYKLLSDPPRELIGLLTGTKSKTIRSHVVIDSNGKLAVVKLNVPAKESSKQALEAAKKAA